jgi:hypothetical protein
MHLVGREASNPALRSNRHWEVFFDAFPPDSGETGLELGNDAWDAGDEPEGDW